MQPPQEIQEGTLQRAQNCAAAARDSRPCWSIWEGMGCKRGFGAPRDAGGAVRGNPRLINKALLQMQIGIVLELFFLCIVTIERRGSVFVGVVQKGKGTLPLPEHHLPPYPGSRSPSPGGQIVPLALMSGQSPSCFVRSLHGETLQINTSKLFPGLFLESCLWQAGRWQTGISPGGFSQRDAYFKRAARLLSLQISAISTPAFREHPCSCEHLTPHQQCHSCSCQQPSSETT